MSDLTDKLLTGVFNLGQSVAVPYVQSLVYGQNPDEAAKLEADRMRLNSLNGSGPASPATSLAQSPLTLRDFLGAEPVAPTQQAAAPPDNTLLYVIGAGVIFGGLMLLKR